jgi:hypothetical protein
MEMMGGVGCGEKKSRRECYQHDFVYSQLIMFMILIAIDSVREHEIALAGIDEGRPNY